MPGKDVPTIDNNPQEPEFAAFLAIDWADQKHTWALQWAGEEKREYGEIEQRVEVVDEWVRTILQKAGGKAVAVCLEQSRGALIYQLMKYPELVLSPIHPAAVGRFRAALYPSGAKDDPKDADLELDLLVQHRKRLRPWNPETVEIRKLQILVEQRRQWVDQRTALSNQLTQALKLYFPQLLRWTNDVTSEMTGALLGRWPTLQSLQAARAQTLRDFFHRQNCRSAVLIEERIEEIGKAQPATNDPAIMETSVLLVTVLVKLIAVLRQSIKELDEKIKVAFQSHPNFAVFDSFPGAGAALGPRLMVAFGTQTGRFSSAQDVQSFTGIAPVVEQSGKSKWVHFRWACPKFLRQTFHEWAGHSIAYSHWARAYYQQQKESGATHHAAVRSLAGKWIRIAYRCWLDGKPYDETIYLNGLRQHGSPLAARIANAA